MNSPRIDFIKHDKYMNYPLQATRGCPYDCEFCSIEHSAGHKYRMKPVEQVVAEIKAYEEHNSREYIGVLKKDYYFVDDNLYVNREYVKELLKAITPLGIKWHAQGTVNLAKDDEILALMAESGCCSFSIGFESIKPESLKEGNKPNVNQVEEYAACITNVAKHGIPPGGYFMFGFDNDDPGIFQATLDFIGKSDLVQCFTSILTPYPGTRLYDRMKPRIFTTTDFLYNSWTCVYTPQNMTARELHNGAHWVGAKISEFEFMWNQLTKFWNYGPWKNNPTLTKKERFALFYIGLKLGAHGMKGYRKFAWRAAFHKNATDFPIIMWSLRRYEMTHSANAANAEAPVARLDTEEKPPAGQPAGQQAS